MGQALAVLENLLHRVRCWAESEGIQAVALVGSHARGAARHDSDVDLVVLTRRKPELIADLRWLDRFGRVERTQIEDWGRVTSIRAWFEGGLEVEFGIAAPEWATDADDGTRIVISSGFEVVSDPAGILETLRIRSRAV